MQGPVLQPFSYDEAHPYASGQHRGVDIGADAAGEAVVAPAVGTVSYAGTVPTNGKTVTIETADGYSVTLTHLGSIAVAKGATVAEQDVVGTIGPSGTPEVDGPYVHLGIRVAADSNGYVDPLGLLPPASGSAATQTSTTSTTASQPVSSGVSAAAPAPASKPAPSAPRKPRVASARGTRAEPVRSQARVHHRERAQKPRAHTGRTRVQQRPAVRDIGSEPTTSSFRRPIVEPAASGPSGVDARHEIRPSADVAPPRRKPSSPLLALVCNWAAALFALSAAFAARRRRSNTSPTVSAQVLHLPLPEDELRQVSRAA